MRTPSPELSQENNPMPSPNSPTNPAIALRHSLLLAAAGFSVLAGAYGVATFSKRPYQGRLAVNLVRPDLSHAVEKKPLFDVLNLEDQKKIARGAGVEVTCTLQLGAKQAELQRTPLFEPETNPSIEKGTSAIRGAESAFAKAIDRCNAVTIEKTVVLVDRTRDGVDVAVAESLRRHLSAAGGVHEAIQRGNGFELSVHRLSASVFDDQPLVVSFPPPQPGNDRELFMRQAKEKVDKAIDAFLAVPMGESRSALAVTFGHILAELRPSPCTRILSFSDYIENDEFTGIEHLESVPRHLLDDADWKDRILKIIRTRVRLPDLHGVTVDLYLLPVPSHLALMNAMSDVFSQWMRAYGANVIQHNGA
jgi:hypothetical protein